jgi:16S rRNA (cytosine967-C5)-methyltransferase
MCGVLLSGAAQLVFLDGVPAYAAIDESVEWAKQMIRPGAGRLANAVLRRIAEMVGETPERAPSWSMAWNEIPLADGSALVLNSDIMPFDERTRFGISTSCPSALYESMLRSYPEKQVREIALHNMLNPPTVLNVEHTLASVDIPDLEPHEKPGFAVYRGNRRALSDLLNSCDDVWVQDVASSEAVHFAERLCPSPDLIVDLCAGLGTKTRQLAAVFPDAKILATDTNMSRRSTLRSVFQWHDRVEVIDPHETHHWLGKADLVLLDVPCSNTGVLARRVEARYRATDSTIAALVSVQRQIITNSIPLLAKDGKILYSTCSIDPKENHDQVMWAASQLQLRIDQEQTTLPSGAPGEPLTRYSDGSYAAMLSQA